MGSVFSGFPELVKRLGLTPKHLLHIGAHEAEELPFYMKAGVGAVTLVEPNPELAQRLVHNLVEFPCGMDVHVVHAACGSTPGRATLHIMSRTNLSTLAEPQGHDKPIGAVEVDVVRVDQIQMAADVLVVDAQGMELDVLRSANLDLLDLVIVECSTVNDPTMAAGYDEIDDFMDDAGFVEVNKWSRDYQWLNRWARGTKARHASRELGAVYDVAYLKGALL